ncbi:mitochondrial outer membrane protein porin 2-like [Lathyrus oleraceus]|uniref:mitochondrial outer membrane protein porin 2-like n=1 Tax=Pisum sativum TaxID=3888 RepID=UPI0021D2FA9C|nr:mitochondrial outer membrane protein porin 2-like [Pisum sativum]
MDGSAPDIFSDIGRLSRDILTKDYNSDQRFTISSSTNSGIDLHSTSLKSRGLSSGDVAAQINHKKSTLLFKVDTESSVLTTFTLTDFVSSAKAVASIRLPDYKSGKIEVQYLHDHAGFTTSVVLNCNPAIDFSALTCGSAGYGWYGGNSLMSTACFCEFMGAKDLLKGFSVTCLRVRRETSALLRNTRARTNCST